MSYDKSLLKESLKLRIFEESSDSSIKFTKEFANCCIETKAAIAAEIPEAMKKVGIVGSEEKYWKPEQKELVKEKIRDAFSLEKNFYGTILISGGCPKGGVDIWAEEVADELNIPKQIYHPKTMDWEGYQARNILIAKNCDVLYCIDPKWRGWKTGGQWTLRKAKELGKVTYLVEIE